MVGNNIKEILDKRGITQKELAEGTGLALANVNRIIKGHSDPNSSTLNKIAEFLNVPVTVFYDSNARNTELVSKFLNSLPDDLVEAFSDKRNLDYLLFGLKCKDSKLSLDDIKIAVEVQEMVQSKKQSNK